MNPVKICIIGWYGTETLGDRAILAGLFSVFSEVFESFSINLGSLYPFFSERTVREDEAFWEEIAGKHVDVALFDSKSRRELTSAIKGCDFLVMGGGPLMDLQEMYMVEFAFRKAKKLRKKTGLMGCGVGPLFQDEFKRSLVRIAENSDIILLRDAVSKVSLLEMVKQFGVKNTLCNIQTAIDPAAFCVQEFLKHGEKTESKSRVCINLRDFPKQCFDVTDAQAERIDEKLIQIVRSVCESAPENEVLLVPMHYFYIGGDDRDYFSRIKQSVGASNLRIQHRPLSLVETMQVFFDAEWCVGMRFHSVVLQTLLNGRNYILDYTEPGKGKIAGLISDLDMTKFYAHRYVSLQELTEEASNIFSADQLNEPFPFPESLLDNVRAVYFAVLHDLFK